MVPFVHQQQAWTIGTSWGPGAFLLSWSAASFDLRKIHGQKTLYFNLTILLFHCHPLSTGYLKFTTRFQSYKCRSIIIPPKKSCDSICPDSDFCPWNPPSGIGGSPRILLLGSLQKLGPATAKTQFGLNLGEGKEKTQLPPNVLGIRWKNLRTIWWENINQLLFSDREFLRASSNYNSRLNSQFVQKWYMKIMKWSLGLIFFLGILGQLIFRSALEST